MAAWTDQAPLGWDVDDPEPVADATIFLLSDLARAISGEILHVDGGFHAVGAVPAHAASEAMSA
jgi:enoyl-[acyl-carrier protein] reductase I